MRSCLYEGRVMHQRYTPVGHRFAYQISMVYLDLDELPLLVGKSALISSRPQAVLSFQTADHLAGCRENLAEAVRDKVEQISGTRPKGRIGLLTQLRHFGYYFSPLNLYFVGDEGDSAPPQVLAEVNNTPWNEQHHYLLSEANRTDPARLEYAHRKEFHVSPFMEMDQEYRWRLSRPGETVAVSIECRQRDQQIFTAAMALKKRELTRSNLRRSVIRYPAMTAQITAAIYLQALKLWWKRCPLFRHPLRTQPSAQPESSAAEAT